jgi:hypothetical protein
MDRESTITVTVLVLLAGFSVYWLARPSHGAHPARGQETAGALPPAKAPVRPEDLPASLKTLGVSLFDAFHDAQMAAVDVSASHVKPGFMDDTGRKICMERQETAEQADNTLNGVAQDMKNGYPGIPAAVEAADSVFRLHQRRREAWSAWREVADFVQPYRPEDLQDREDLSGRLDALKSAAQRADHEAGLAEGLSANAVNVLYAGCASARVAVEQPAPVVVEPPPSPAMIHLSDGRTVPAGTTVMGAYTPKAPRP